MVNCYVLRITPGGIHKGTDQTLLNKSKNIVSIGWSHYPANIIEKNETEINEIISEEEIKRGKSNKNHITYISSVFKTFLII